MKISATEWPPKLEWQCFFCDVMFPYGMIPGGTWTIFDKSQGLNVETNAVCQRCKDKLNMRKGSL